MFQPFSSFIGGMIKSFFGVDFSAETELVSIVGKRRLGSIRNINSFKSLSFSSFSLARSSFICFLSCSFSSSLSIFATNASLNFFSSSSSIFFSSSLSFSSSKICSSVFSSESLFSSNITRGITFFESEIPCCSNLSFRSASSARFVSLAFLRLAVLRAFITSSSICLITRLRPPDRRALNLFSLVLAFRCSLAAFSLASFASFSLRSLIAFGSVGNLATTEFQYSSSSTFF